MALPPRLHAGVAVLNPLVVSRYCLREFALLRRRRADGAAARGYEWCLGLLARQPKQRCDVLHVGPEWIDVETATSQEAAEHR